MSPSIGTPEMQTYSDSWRLLLPLVAVALSGYGGINATKSVSPLDFLLPGLHVRNTPTTPVTPTGTNAVVCQHTPIPPQPSP